MMRTMVGLACVVMALPLRAQTVAMYPGELARVVAAQRTPEVVTVQLSNALLADAIQTIAERSGVTMVFSPSQLPHRRVTYAASRVPVEQALREVLRGTALRAERVEGGGFRLVKEAVADGFIVGRVVHGKTKAPLPGVTVSVGNGSPQVTTGPDGTFRLPVPAGEHTVSIRGIGFARQVRRVTVRGEETVAVDVALDPSASVLDEVVVTGSVVATERRAVPHPITVITAAEIEKRGITRIEQLFRGEVPGVYALERGTVDYSTLEDFGGIRSAIYSRGASTLTGGGTPLKTYVDGVELVDVTYLGTLDPQNIERIEIVSGPQAATIYGSGAMGGVMQIFTKRGQQHTAPVLTATLRYGMLQNNFSEGLTPTHNHGVGLQGSMGPAFSYSGNISYVYTGQWQPGLYRRQYGGSLGATFTPGKLTVGGSYQVTGTTQGTWTGWTSSDAYGALAAIRSGQLAGSGFQLAQQRSPHTQTSSNYGASLNVDYRMSSVWQHHATLGRSQNVLMLKPVAPRFFANTIGSDTLFVVRRVNGQRMTWNYNTSFIASPSWLSSTLTIGANGSVGDQITVHGTMVNSSASTIVGPSGTDGPTVSLPMNDHIWGGFGRWQVGILGKLYTTFSFRVEQNPSYGRNVKFDFTPTNGLSYTLERGIVSAKLMASYGRATRAPLAHYKEGQTTTDPFTEPSTYVNWFSNPDIRPEYSRGPQAGLELYIGNLGSLTINHYQQKITDLIQAVYTDSVWLQFPAYDFGYWLRQGQMRNAATIRQFGWDGTGSVNVGPVTVRGTYSWADSRLLWRDDSFCCYQAPGSFLGVPTHSGSVTIGYAHGKNSVSMITNFTGAVNRGMSGTALYRRVTSARLAMYDRERASTSVFDNAVKEAPGYAKADLSAMHRLSRQLSVTMHIMNIRNNFSSDMNDLSPSLGRQTTLGMSYQFGNP